MQPLNLGSGQQLSFNTRNLLIIGSNGSGKSSLMRAIDQNNPNCSIISAHKNLMLKQGQFKGQEDTWLRANKSSFESLTTGGGQKPLHSNTIQNDFNQTIEILIREYERTSVKALNAGQSVKDINRQLDMVMELWNEIFQDRLLSFDVDNQKIVCQIKPGGSPYEIESLSDGERCALYLLLKLALSINENFVVIDEPETYLNPALVNSLFDLCESTFKTIHFIYLSHDLDFVTSRKGCDTFWIKSYTYPQTWQIEKLEYDNIPTELLARIVGTKKQKILFVESTADKDARLYQAIYPDFKVWPVGGCENVINYTKAFNSSVEKFNKTYFGLIDRDLRSDDELASLSLSGVLATPVAIYENLFLKEEVVSFVFTQLGRTDFDAKSQNLKDAVRRELSSANYKKAYVKTKLLQKFNQEIDQIASGTSSFSPDLVMYATELNQIESKTYNEQLACYNQKNLSGCVNAIGYTWSGWQEQVLNIFNTDKAEEFRNLWLQFMPVIGEEDA